MSEHAGRAAKGSRHANVAGVAQVAGIANLATLLFAAGGLLAVACSGGGGPAPNGTGGSGTGGATGPGTGGASTGGTNPGTGGAGTGGRGGQPAEATGGKGTGGVAASGGSAGSPAGGSAIAGRSGTGGAGGASGSGGAGGSSAANPAVPTASTGSKYKFSFGNVVFEIDPPNGGRVSKLSLSGFDLIVPSGTDPTTWGSVFWTSPRADWTPKTWPPPTAIDNGPYTGSISGTHVVVTGQADSGLGVSMAKDYSADATTGWMTIKYTINATKALKAAPWEVSRVPRGGLVFFPFNGTVTAGPLTLTQSGGVAWFDDAAKSATSPDGAKCAADGAGWTAYAVSGKLFLKKFTDQPASAQAPGEGEVDVYPGAGFLEFEVQGPYTSIPASGNLPWTMQWRVVEIPSSVTVAPGSATLLEFARQQLGL